MAHLTSPEQRSFCRHRRSDFATLRVQLPLTSTPTILIRDRTPPAPPPRFSATEHALVCFPLLEAAIAFTFDNLFNHVTGTVCTSPVSSNEVERLVHTLNHQRSTRRLPGLDSSRKFTTRGSTAHISRLNRAYLTTHPRAAAPPETSDFAQVLSILFFLATNLDRAT